jgi:hypothetical protein
LNDESIKLNAEINQRRDLLSKLMGEDEVVKDETSKAGQVNEKLKKQMEEFKVPHVSLLLCI